MSAKDWRNEGAILKSLVGKPMAKNRKGKNSLALDRKRNNRMSNTSNYKLHCHSSQPTPGVFTSVTHNSLESSEA
jgi:hypothetical protein